MSATKAVKTVEDTISFTVNRTQWNDKKHTNVPEREVPCSNGLKWNIDYSAFGGFSSRYFSVYLNTSMSTTATMTVTIDGSSIERTFDNGLCYEKQIGGNVTRRDQLDPLFIDDFLLITCKVIFDVEVPCSYLKPSVFLSCEHIPADLKLVMESGCLEVHRSFLSLMSPVFHAMLTLDTKESKSGKVQITDFDFEIVKASIDFCYGRELTDSSVKTIVGILRFADKYDIKAIVNLLEKIPVLNLSIYTFPVVVHYAYDCSKDALFDKCWRFFENNLNMLKVLEGFIYLPPELVVHLIRSVHLFILSIFDVLDYAYENGLDFVVEYLEKPLLESMTLDDFCPAVKYAWKCSRDNLKKACATFVNTHRIEVTTSKSFFDLSPEVVYEVLKLACELDDIAD